METRVDLPFLCDEGVSLFVVPPRIDVPRTLHLSSVTMTGLSSAQVMFKEVDSIDVAEELIGCHLLIEADKAPALLAIEGHDLIGCAVLDDAEGLLGHVVDMQEGGYQALLVVRSDDDEHEILIPFVEGIVQGIEDDVVHVSCPQGLTEL